MRKIALFAIALAAITWTAGTQTVNAQSTTETKKQTTQNVTVAEGDTLSAIAEKHNTTYLRIYYANEAIVNPDIINPGDIYRIPAADEQLTERPLPQPVVATVAYSSPYTVPATQYRPQTYSAPAATSYAAPAVTGNDAKAFIYTRESGNNPNATNPNGCYGLGQDCNGVLRNQCGADYACQDAYFERYAANRYGGWDGAKAFWDTHGWW